MLGEETSGNQQAYIAGPEKKTGILACPLGKQLSNFVALGKTLFIFSRH